MTTTAYTSFNQVSHASWTDATDLFTDDSNYAEKYVLNNTMSGDLEFPLRAWQGPTLTSEDIITDVGIEFRGTIYSPTAYTESTPCKWYTMIDGTSATLDQTTGKYIDIVADASPTYIYLNGTPEYWGTTSADLIDQFNNNVDPLDWEDLHVGIHNDGTGLNVYIRVYWVGLRLTYGTPSEGGVLLGNPVT